MQIILVPGGVRKGAPISLAPRYLIVIAVALLALLPALVGIVAYNLADYLDRQHGGPALSAYRNELTKSRAQLRRTREEATRHLNALALKIGSLQAQVLRLNALGGRLTGMAGINKREFSFDTVPTLAASVLGTGSLSSPDITRDMQRLASELDRSQARLMALESLVLDRKLNVAVVSAGWPVEGGWVASGFGERIDPFTGKHAPQDGIDIAATFGSPVLAVDDGVVNTAGERDAQGLVVEITHPSGLVTRYAHCSALTVKQGDRVTRGQPIAKVGAAGWPIGPHLHFAILRDHEPVNPLAYLPTSDNPPAADAGAKSTR